MPASSTNGHHSTDRSTHHTTISLVDDHPAVRKAVARAIEGTMDLEVCSEAGSSEEALRQIEEQKPDVAIIDISLSDGHGLELIRDIQERAPNVSMIVFSMYDEDVYAERAIRAGASGYLMKSESIERVIEAIRCVDDGELFLSRRMYSRILVGRSSEPSFAIDELTEREMTVFRLLGQGLTVEEIQERLDLSRKTIETYRRRAKEKLGHDSVNELLQYAVQWTHGRDLDGASATEPARVEASE